MSQPHIWILPGVFNEGGYGGGEGVYLPETTSGSHIWDEMVRGGGALFGGVGTPPTTHGAGAHLNIHPPPTQLPNNKTRKTG